MSESTITKKAIALAFKEVMKEKQFDKITVQDITKKCGLNRQTFYYHFEDRYDLMNWIYYNEVFLPLVEVLTEDNYHDSFLIMFKIMYKDKDFYKNAFTMSAHYGFKEYLYSILETLVETINKQKKESLEVCFYAHGLLGIITTWIKQGMPYSPEEMAKQVTDILGKTKNIL